MSPKNPIAALLNIRQPADVSRAVIATTAIATLASCVIALLLEIALGQTEPTSLVRTVTIAVLIPLILTPIISQRVYTLFLALLRSKREIEQLTRVDHLTGVFNRRYFRELAERELALARRYGRELAVLMLDIDHFKKVNDAYGHLAGDEALTAVAGLIERSSRGTDIMARFGGEEFVMLLPETSLQDAVGMAERIRQTISRSELPAGKAKVNLTISIGITTDSNHGEPLDELINRADRGLYLAKENGRDRAEVWLGADSPQGRLAFV